MILLMGIAGSGKGTQGQLLVDKHGYKVVSTGDAVRQYASEEQRQRMLDGQLLRDDEITELLERVLADLSDLDHVVLDGYPRTLQQAQWLLAQAKAGRFTLQQAFHLVASRQAVKQRLLGRARIDDTEEAIEKRFDEYERSTAPILKWLADNGVEVVNINAERSVEDVSADITSHLK